jgi:hypothetical protein
LFRALCEAHLKGPVILLLGWLLDILSARPKWINLLAFDIPGIDGGGLFGLG